MYKDAEDGLTDKDAEDGPTDKDAENRPTVHFHMLYEAEAIEVSAHCNKKSKWHILEDSKPHPVGINLILYCYVFVYAPLLGV